MAKQEITIVDKAQRKYATIPASEYGGKMAEAMPPMNFGNPPSAGSTKNKMESRKTGRMETILGVQTEESETTFSLEMALPTGLPGRALTMKIVNQEWNALPSETTRVPEIHQLMGFDLWQEYFMSGTESVKKLFPQGDPSVADAFKRKGTTLRSSMKMYMSMPGPDAGAASSATPEMGAPFMEINYEIVNLSTAPVDDVFFQIPEGYGATTFAELMNGMTKGRLQAQKEQAAKLSPKPVAGDAQVYVPDLVPLTQSELELPEEARRTGTQGIVELLLTVGADGHVAKAEALSGPDLLRKLAVKAVKDWTFHPVVRNGVAVAAYTDAMVPYFDWSKGQGAGTPSMQDEMAAIQRRSDLEQSLPRTPQEKLADLERDSLGGGNLKERRFYALNKMTDAALKLGEDAKAEAYAHELLSASANFPKDWNYGNAIYDGHLALGLIAIRKNDIETARRELLESGKTPGSPTLDSFGPNMVLAKELLEKGERGAVVEYLSSCAGFWKMGGERLRAWTETINKGEMPVFGVNLR